MYWIYKKSVDIERIEQYPNSKINKYQNEEKNRGKIYCNPLDIAYKYQHPLFGKYASKDAADPTRILLKEPIIFLLPSAVDSIIRMISSAGTSTKTGS